MSLLWKTAGLSDAQHEALARVDAIPGKGDDISGEHLKTLLGEHKIVHHEAKDDPTFGPVEHDVNFEDYTHTHHPSEALHTSQETMQRSSLKHYIRSGHEHMTHGDSDAFDGPGEGFENEPYRPRTYSHGDHWDADHWIENGHHRILAARMLGKAVVADSGWTDRCSCPTARSH